jgi:hypothetical protein
MIAFQNKKISSFQKNNLLFYWSTNKSKTMSNSLGLIFNSSKNTNNGRIRIKNDLFFCFIFFSFLLQLIKCNPNENKNLKEKSEQIVFGKNELNENDSKFDWSEEYYQTEESKYENKINEGNQIIYINKVIQSRTKEFSKPIIQKADNNLQF